MPVDQQFEHALAEFLADESTVQAMVHASESGRPAVEAIGTDLVEQFGDRVRPDTVKRHIGRLVRPLMEAQGFLPHKRHRHAESILFTEGTVYRSDPESIGTVLGRHGITVSPDVLRREVRDAAALVVGNPAFRQAPRHLDWGHLASAPATGDLRPQLRAFASALEHELAQHDRRRHASQQTN